MVTWPTIPECTPDDLEQIALGVAGVVRTIDPGDLGPDYVDALCRLVTSLSQDLSAEIDRAVDAARQARTLELQVAALTSELDEERSLHRTSIADMDRLDRDLASARQAIAEREDEIARVNNARQAEVNEAAEQRQRADNAEARAEVLEMTAKAMSALITTTEPVTPAQIIHAVDGRVARALVREKIISKAFGQKLEECMAQLEERQATDALNDSLRSATKAITGKPYEVMAQDLDEELAAHPEPGPLHHARDQRPSAHENREDEPCPDGGCKHEHDDWPAGSVTQRDLAYDQCPNCGWTAAEVSERRIHAQERIAVESGWVELDPEVTTP